MSDAPEKVKICEFCKRALINEKPQICLLCKKVLCSEHIQPEDHICERVDWKGMEKDKENLNLRRTEEMRQFSKDFKRDWEIRWWAERIAWLIIILILAALVWNYYLNKAPSASSNINQTVIAAVNVSNESINNNENVTMTIPSTPLQPLVINAT